jgi:uncharacterized membrane protein (UPF0127 family)
MELEQVGNGYQLVEQVMVTDLFFKRLKGLMFTKSYLLAAAFIFDPSIGTQEIT